MSTQACKQTPGAKPQLSYRGRLGTLPRPDARGAPLVHGSAPGSWRGRRWSLLQLPACRPSCSPSGARRLFVVTRLLYYCSNSLLRFPFSTFFLTCFLILRAPSAFCIPRKHTPQAHLMGLRLWTHQACFLDCLFPLCF